ncbi:MAG: pyrimidine 5'-nucleotidase, partial [Chloroflexi bacterium]|nr:pyrimidine 5'-nucleotidase [Chloroflexota bacterium]
MPPSPYQVLFFDLDDTLYPGSSGLWDAIGERISLFMVERLRIRPDEVHTLRKHYYAAYGSTLRGLLADYHVDPRDYCNFAHDLPLERYLHPDPALAAMLSALPQRKIIFTNADANHAERVLARLALRQHFSAIVDIYALGLLHNKPTPQAYAIALAVAGNPQPAACVLIEDSLSNLAPARALGITTVYV